MTEARVRISELVGRVQHGGERIVLTRHGRAAAVLVPAEDLDRLLAAEAAAEPENPFVVREEVVVAASAAPVWDALLVEPRRRLWWPGVAVVDHVGAGFAVADGAVTGEVDELLEERTLVVGWREEGWRASTTVRLELAETPGSTTVRLHHTGFDRLPDGAAQAERHRVAWRRRLEAWRDAVAPALD